LVGDVPFSKFLLGIVFLIDTCLDGEKKLVLLIFVGYFSAFLVGVISLLFNLDGDMKLLNIALDIFEDDTVPGITMELETCGVLSSIWLYAILTGEGDFDLFMAPLRL
jgi:hypothetical protein